MQFAYCVLYVEDVAATLEFYEKAFGLKTKVLHESGDYGELAVGETALSFSSHKLMREIGKSPGRPKPDAPTFEIAFTTDDVAKAMKQAVNNGARVVQEVEEMPWGQTTAYVRDPNDFLVELCTPIGG